MEADPITSDQKQTMIAETIDSLENQNIDIRQIVNNLDGLRRTCDTMLETLESQIKRFDQIKKRK